MRGPGEVVIQLVKGMAHIGHLHHAAACFAHEPSVRILALVQTRPPFSTQAFTPGDQGARIFFSFKPFSGRDSRLTLASIRPLKGASRKKR